MRWIIGIWMVCSSLFSDVIAIASDGDTSHSDISSNASRADYYILVNDKGETL